LQIIQTLVTDIEPDSKVRVAMNEINAAVRQRAAALEKAEAGARTACKHVIRQEAVVAVLYQLRLSGQSCLPAMRVRTRDVLYFVIFRKTAGRCS